MKTLFFSFSLTLFFFSPIFAFQDVSKTSEYNEQINLLKNKKVIKNADKFFPNKNISRIAFVQMMYRGNIFPQKCPYPGIRFTDTKLNQWYSPALLKGVVCGGITGDKNGAFRLNDAVSYAEAATLLDRSVNGKEQSSPWYKRGIQFLEQNSFILHEKVQPDTKINRGQAAYLIQNTSELKAPQFSGKKLVESARKQKGVVTSYDTGYYAGGFPPNNTGSCTDVVERALRDIGYDWKGLVDAHMKKNPHLYSSQYDANINFRRF